jgi:hypothetical protein
MTTLPVYFEQRRVGTIDVDKTGPGFTYDPNWVALRGAFPISLTMPLIGGKADMSPSRPDPDRSRQWHASHQRTHPFVRDPDGRADYVGGAFLTLGAFGHIETIEEQR